MPEMGPRGRILAEMNRLRLTIDSTFVPWSQSRHKAEKDRSLNWKVVLLRNGKEGILETDYMAGIAHTPAYAWIPHAGLDYRNRLSIDEAKALETETERGFACYPNRPEMVDKKKPIKPDEADVMYSLLNDAEAIDHPDFESWARDMGYDEDSRKAEAIYRACLETGLKIRSAVGDEGLVALRKAAEGY